MRNNKISFFIPSLRGGGAERIMLNLVNSFSEKDYEVDLLLAQKEGHYLSKVSSKVTIVNLRSSNILKSLIPLIIYVKKEKPKVLVSTLTHVDIISILAKILSMTNTKIVVRVANTFSEALKNNSYFVRFILFHGVKVLYRFADEIVAVSNGVADDLSKTINISRERIKVIYNPIDIDGIKNKCIEPTNHPWLKNKTAPIILAVGRLTAEKDYPTLIKAFSNISKENNFRLIILGEGKKRNELEGLIKELNLNGKISLPGFVENPYAFMYNCDVFVLSSITEGLPNTLIEAMVCGCHVISTDCPYGPKEILDNGKYGKLVKVGDKNALADAIIETLENPLNPRDLIRRINDVFSKNKNVEKYLEIIQKI